MEQPNKQQHMHTSKHITPLLPSGEHYLIHFALYLIKESLLFRLFVQQFSMRAVKLFMVSNKTTAAQVGGVNGACNFNNTSSHISSTQSLKPLTARGLFLTHLHFRSYIFLRGAMGGKL